MDKVIVYRSTAEGIGDWMFPILDKLTHKEGENYFDYIERISKSSWARKVKLADLEDNMSDLEECSLKDKYRFAHYLLMIADTKDQPDVWEKEWRESLK